MFYLFLYRNSPKYLLGNALLSQFNEFLYIVKKNLLKLYSNLIANLADFSE